MARGVLAVAALLLPAAAGCGGGGQEDAAALFERFERSLRETPSHSLSVRGRLTAMEEGKEKEFPYSGAWRSAPGNLLRFDFEGRDRSGHEGRWSVSGAITSDLSDPGYHVSVPARTGFLLVAARDWLPSTLSHWSLPWNRPPADGFRFAEGDAPGRRHLAYALRLERGNRVQVELVLDDRTLAPLRRTASLETPAGPLRLEETYEGWSTALLPGDAFRGEAGGR